MPAAKRTPAQRDMDAELIGRLLLQCYTLRQIAAEIGRIRPYTLCLTAVAKQVTKIRESWRASAVEAVAYLKEKELRGLDLQESEAWDAWHRSKQDKTKRTIEEPVGADGAAKGKRLRGSIEGQCGDPAFLRLILDIRERRAKLVGLDAPSRQELSGVDGGPIRSVSEGAVVVLPAKEFEQVLQEHAGNGHANGNGTNGHSPAAGPADGLRP